MIRRSRFEVHPSTQAGYRAARRRLRSAFARWSEATASKFGPDSFEELIHLKWRHLDGHLTRWRTADLDAVLLELFPAKVIVEDADLDDVVLEAATFIRFLADTGLIDPASDKPQQLCAHLEHIEGRFLRRMADPARYSPGKRFWLAAAQAGVPLDDDKAVAAFVKQFNARPQASRDAARGPSTNSTRPSQRTRTTPPGTRPPPRSARRR
ncbi:MAG: hypothetical protein LC790_16335 [Actinobacteria bacterium]|nr:hypothetical protein [Actinomycetota bacterium]